jgi:hypothetical protein
MTHPKICRNLDPDEALGRGWRMGASVSGAGLLGDHGPRAGIYIAVVQSPALEWRLFC